MALLGFLRTDLLALPNSPATGCCNQVSVCTAGRRIVPGEMSQYNQLKGKADGSIFSWRKTGDSHIITDEKRRTASLLFLK